MKSGDKMETEEISKTELEENTTIPERPVETLETNKIGPQELYTFGRKVIYADYKEYLEEIENLYKKLSII